MYPVEFLNSVELSSIPPHLMKLKKGMPIKLMRNMQPREGHVNGQRYTIVSMSKRIIHAKIAGDGPFAGNEILIPRILFHPEDKRIPFEFERRQFPIRPCAAMTSNGSQGCGFKIVGLNLSQDFFGHGQLYVAMSRCRNPHALKIYRPKTLDPKLRNYMKNVVYTEILSKDADYKTLANEDNEDFSFNLSDDEFMDIIPNQAATTLPIQERHEMLEEDELELENAMAAFDENIVHEDMD